MDIVLQVVAFVLFFGFFSYACIFADPDTSEVGRLFARTIPSALFRGLGRAIGPNRLARLRKLSDRAFQIVYLFVVLGSWTVVFFYGYPAIEESTYVDSRHRYAGYVVFLLCMGSWHYACNVGPGNVTARTIQLFDHYEYDDFLFANKVCPTLGIRKIARSKYDRFSGRHVPRYDHYCGWVNQAVGERNYRWFLLFLTIHVFMCLYGSWAMASVLYGEIAEKDLLHATFFNAVTGAEVEADFIIVFHYMFTRHSQICGVLLLMLVMTAMLGVFLAFHVYITSRGMTTNEFFKWRSARRWHRRETKLYRQALQDGRIGPKGDERAISKQVPDGDVGCTGLVAVEEDPSDARSDDDVTDPGPMPTNIYDRGIWANWSEVLFPLSFRDAAIRRYRSSTKVGKASDDENNPKPKRT